MIEAYLNHFSLVEFGINVSFAFIVQLEAIHLYNVCFRRI